MNIYDVVVQDNRGSRPDRNIETRRLVAETAQQAVDKVRAALNFTKGDKHLHIVAVNQIVGVSDWE